MPEPELNSNNPEPDITETPKAEPAENPLAADVPGEPSAESAELAKLRAENARQKAAIDKAAKEAADYKKALRAKQSAEERAAAEAQEERDAIQQELAELRKEKAMAQTGKKLMGFISDEKTATAIAEYLYGAEDADAAIEAFGQAWADREKALRAEFGKPDKPAAGNVEGKRQSFGIELARNLAKGRAGSGQSFNDIAGFYAGSIR